MAPIQKAIRDLERCIRKKKDKGESTEILDKKLALLFDDKTISDQIQKEKRNSAKYHMIKFIERQKLVRKIRSIDQQLASTTESADPDALKSSKASLMEQLAYVLYYPKELKYVALFAESGETVGKNEKLRLSAHKTAVEQWKNDTASGAQDRVMRVILGEDKEDCGKSNVKKKRSDVEEGDEGDNDHEDIVEEGVMRRTTESKTDVMTYGNKDIQQKKKKAKIVQAPPPIVEEVIDFPSGQEPDSFFLEEQVIESKMSALQSINRKYPPEKNQNYSRNNYNNSTSFNSNKNVTTEYGNYGRGLSDGKDRRGLNAKYGSAGGANKKPAYGSGTFSSFAPTKQSARLQKWQQRKGSH